MPLLAVPWMQPVQCSCSANVPATGEVAQAASDWVRKTPPAANTPLSVLVDIAVAGRLQFGAVDSQEHPQTFPCTEMSPTCCWPEWLVRVAVHQITTSAGDDAFDTEYLIVRKGGRLDAGWSGVHNMMQALPVSSLPAYTASSCISRSTLTQCSRPQCSPGLARLHLMLQLLSLLAAASSADPPMGPEM